MSSLVRMLGVLDVFSEDVPVWTVDRLVEELGYSRSTAYRFFWINWHTLLQGLSLSTGLNRTPILPDPRKAVLLK